MNIMQISFTPTINSAGGAEKVFCNLANYLCQNNTVMNVISEGKKGSPFYYLDSRVQFKDLLDEELHWSLSLKVKHEIARILKKVGLKKDYLPKVVYKFDKIRDKLKCLIGQFAPDLILCYQPYLLSLLNDIDFKLDKVIVMFHMFPVIDDLSKEEKWLLKRVKYIQVLTEGAKEYLRRNGFNRIVVIGNALDRSSDEVEKFIPKSREKQIVCVARLDKKQKRQHLLIEAFAKIANKHNEWNLYFWGGNPAPREYDEYLKKIVKKNHLDNRVKFLGISKDVQHDIRNSSIFVIPSLYEGFCITVAEAMQLGIPCIGFKSCSGVNELITHNVNGFLASDGVDSLAKAIDYLIDEVDLRNRFGKNAIKSIRRYEKEQIFSKWNKILH